MSSEITGTSSGLMKLKFPDGFTKCIPVIPRYLIEWKKRKSFPPEGFGFLLASIPMRKAEIDCDERR